MHVLVSGGLGFIGSHTCVELLNVGHEVVAVDNLYNSKEIIKENIEKVTDKKLVYYNADICDEVAMNEIFEENKVEAVIHLAGYKIVGESIQNPLAYYNNNIVSTLVLCDVMSKHNCKKLVFSSSATVYGNPEKIPIDEECRLGPTTSPYGTTKLLIEHILKDLYVSDNEWNIALLRYFNPIGALESGLIGETSNGVPNNLIPYMVKVASKELPVLHLYGDVCSLSGGTGIRDYIHVVDLAKGNVCALNKLEKEHVGVDTYNIGTGRGYSVLELVKAFEEENKVEIPYEIHPRKAGDILICYANTKKSCDELGFKVKKTLEDMIKDSWRCWRL